MSFPSRGFYAFVGDDSLLPCARAHMSQRRDRVLAVRAWVDGLKDVPMKG